MTRLKIILLAAGASLLATVPAQAQHQGHNMPGMKMPMPAKKPAAKKPAAKKPVAKRPAAKQAGREKAGGQTACGSQKPAVRKSPPAPRRRPIRTPVMTWRPCPPHRHRRRTDPHAGHDMGAMTGGAPAGTDLPAGNAPPPPVPTDFAADAVYGAEAQGHGRHHLNKFHGGQRFGQIMFNIAEAQIRSGRDAFEWDGEGWYGGDINRLVIKSEGEGAFGRSVEQAEVQALYSRTVGPYFNVQAGARYDFKPNPSRVYAVVALEGLAPSFFDVEGSLFLSNKGELMARAEGYYDQRITQRLILQPRAELNFAAQNSRALGVGAGLSDAEIGLRLRYDIRREFAPYVGVQYRRAFGKTRQYLRDEGEEAGGWSLLTGVRVWF